MKTTKQIEARIVALEHRLKDGLDVAYDISLLKDCLNKGDAEIHQIGIEAYARMDFKTANICSWLLED